MARHSALIGLMVLLMMWGCTPPEENVVKVTRIHEINKVCSVHDESMGIVVVVDVEATPKTRVCQFSEWDSTSMGRTYRGTRFLELKSYRHELYPNDPYYRCDWPLSSVTMESPLFFLG
ncbi:MAG: hypothetical protein HW380_3592 [Magnetococcales bacterium]|nr:hypothetical protein [Magnetococcales bacterium]HIJ82918.1 hypothetical protein [Magnetococcales bacterium]